MRLFTEKGVRLATSMFCQPRSIRALRHSFFWRGRKDSPALGPIAFFWAKKRPLLRSHKGRGRYRPPTLSKKDFDGFSVRFDQTD